MNAPPIDDVVASNVRAELARAGLLRGDLVELGWTPSKISRKLNGHTPLTLREIEQIAEFLDVPLDALIPTDKEQDT